MRISATWDIHNLKKCLGQVETFLTHVDASLCQFVLTCVNSHVISFSIYFLCNHATSNISFELVYTHTEYKTIQK